MKNIIKIHNGNNLGHLLESISKNEINNLTYYIYIKDEISDDKKELPPNIRIITAKSMLGFEMNESEDLLFLNEYVNLTDDIVLKYLELPIQCGVLKFANTNDLKSIFVFNAKLFLDFIKSHPSSLGNFYVPHLVASQYENVVANEKDEDFVKFITFESLDEIGEKLSLISKEIRKWKEIIYLNKTPDNLNLKIEDILSLFNLSINLISKLENDKLMQMIDSISRALSLNAGKVSKKNESLLPSITFVSDENQYKYAITNTIMILSQVKTGIEKVKINVVLVGMTTKKYKSKLEKILLKYDFLKNVNLVFVNSDYIKIRSMNTKHITFAGNGRLYLPLLLEDHSTWYLDNDVVVLGDVTNALKIFDMNLAYGRRWINNYVKVRKGLNRDLYYPNPNGYYNSGSIHIPLDVMRRMDFTLKAEKIDSILKSNDQDIINSLINFEEIPWRLNISRDKTEKEYDWIFENEEINVFHFLSVHKQWNKKTFESIGEVAGSLTSDEFKKMEKPKKIWWKYHKNIWGFKS